KRSSKARECAAGWVNWSSKARAMPSRRRLRSWVRVCWLSIKVLSVVVGGSAHIGVRGQRRIEGEALSGLPIETGGKDGGHTLAGTRADEQSPGAGGFQPCVAILAGKRQHAQAGAGTLLGMGLGFPDVAHAA